jgi:hypothetical protein
MDEKNVLPVPPALPSNSPKAATILHRIATALLWIAFLLATFLTGCRVSHSVTQSFTNRTTGDSISVRYEQVGRTSKMLK